MKIPVQFALLVASVLCASPTFAQGKLSPLPTLPEDSVPSWVFYWFLGVIILIGGIWTAITKALWTRAVEAENRRSGLTEEEKTWVRELHTWHKAFDESQVPIWYVPRSWNGLLKQLETDHDTMLGLLKKLVEQNELVIADLRDQIRECRGEQSQQQIKMLKLAVRVQRAVEALAGLKPPEIENDLSD